MIESDDSVEAMHWPIALALLLIGRCHGWRCEKGVDLICGNHTIPHKDVTKAFKKAKDADDLTCAEFGCAYPKRCKVWVIKAQKENKKKHKEARGEVAVVGAKFDKKYSICMASLQGEECRCNNKDLK